MCIETKFKNDFASASIPFYGPTGYALLLLVVGFSEHLCEWVREKAETRRFSNLTDR